MTQIRVENLSVRFISQAKYVLDNVSLSFNTNERILILGESGSGKSTLLLAVLGLLQRCENAEVTGDVFIGDKAVGQMKPREVCQKVGLVFQNPESQFCMLYPEDEVAFGLENLALKSELMQKIINKSCEDVGFNSRLYAQQINNLSGGEQQRLALASIFAQGAEMFLLDEPTANLDPQGRRQVADSTQAAVDKGKGLLVVEHNLEPWFPLLERLVIIKDGQILDDGEPRAIFKKWGAKLGKLGIWRPYAVRVYEELIKLGYNLKEIPLNTQELADMVLAEKIPETIVAEVFARTPENGGIKSNNSLNNKTLMELKALSVGYRKDEEILKDVDLKLVEGDFFALVGANGSGKSTLAKTLIQMVQPISGSITLLDTDLRDMNLRDICSIIGYVFQNPEHQFVEDSVWSELAYSVDQLDIREDKKKDMITSLLKEFDLENVAKSNPFSLSGGQKRRLSVATMLVGQQKILILDEPTFGQDEKSAYKLMNKLGELNKNGVTIFMITHDLDLVEEYANKVAVMVKQSIAFCGETRELWKQHGLIKESGLELPCKIKVRTRIEKNDKAE